MLPVYCTREDVMAALDVAETRAHRRADRPGLNTASAFALRAGIEV